MNLISTLIATEFLWAYFHTVCNVENGECLLTRWSKKGKTSNIIYFIRKKNHNLCQSFMESSDNYNDGNIGDDYKKDDITLDQVDVLLYKKEKY